MIKKPTRHRTDDTRNISFVVQTLPNKLNLYSVEDKYSIDSTRAEMNTFIYGYNNLEGSNKVMWTLKFSQFLSKLASLPSGVVYKDFIATFTQIVQEFRLLASSYDADLDVVTKVQGLLSQLYKELERLMEDDEELKRFVEGQSPELLQQTHAVG